MREKEIEERRKRREERHRLQQAAEAEGDEGIPSSGARLGSVIKGRGGEATAAMAMASEEAPEDPTSKDWRLARHETMIEDKENRDRQESSRGTKKDTLKDLRHKLKGKVVMQK